MASTITPIDTQIAGLAQTFQTAIKATLKVESDPLNKTQALKDTVDVRRSVYTDIKTNFTNLQNALQALISSQATYGLNQTSAVTVTPSTGTVLTANVASDAAVGEYDVVVSQLAKAQSKSTSLSVSGIDIALGKSGTFWMGGSGTAAYTLGASTTVTAGSTSTVYSGQRELGTGNYTLEARDYGGSRQFRLVDADGTAVSIRNMIDGTSYTSDWQTMNSGSFDTGRGMTLTMSTAGTTTSTSLAYTAAGTSISINSTDTLRTITAAINGASQPEGRDFKASIVANQLVLTGARTGENHGMLFTDGASLGFGADLQAAQNAKFTVNGMPVSRAVNSKLTDVVSGLTLNLASDAEGKSAHLSIAASSDKAAALMTTLVNSFNTAMSHLKDKLASTPSTVNGKTTYTRGPVSGEATLRSLRQDMLGRMTNNFTNSGSYTNLSQIGLSFDKDMKLSFNATTFSSAMQSSRSSVTSLLDAGLGSINTVVSNYVGSSGSLSLSLSSLDDQSKNYDARILKYNETLEKRKETLFNKYMGYQNQLVEYGYTAQWLGIMTGTNTNTSA
jgi:flagellar hook-associated protein 2